MTSTSATTEVSMTEVEERPLDTESMKDDEKENCNIICDGETHNTLGNNVDFAGVFDKFKKHCYVRNLIELNEKSHAVGFAYRMLFEVGPAAQKNKTSDFVKTFTFPVMVPALDENGRILKDDNGEEILVTKTGNEFKKVIVLNGNIQEPPAENDDCMILSLEHACLIALELMKPVIRLAMTNEPPKFILTPLAMPIYSVQSIKAMATIFTVSLDEMLIKINCSAQSSGHLLNSSDVNCAVACALFGTRSMTMSEERYQIIERTMNDYINSAATHDATHMIIYSLFAMGGYFDEQTKAVLDKLFNQFQSVEKETECGILANDTDKILVRLMKYLAGKECMNPPELLKVFQFGIDVDLKKLCHEYEIEMDETESIVNWSQLPDQFGKYFEKPNIEKMIESILTIGNDLPSE